MTIVRQLLLSACLVLSALPSAAAAEQELLVTGTFSNLRYHRETGDLSGVEVKIVPARGGQGRLRYQGALQIAEGGPSESMVVDVTVQRNKISFQIPGERLVRGRGYWDR